jgi:hypothetical protein
MTDSGLVLKGALTHVKRALKQRGFASRGTTFYRTSDQGNTVALSVQKSRHSSDAEAQITINYWVYCVRIGEKLEDDPSWALDVAMAHWRRRLAEGGREKWLHVKATDHVEETATAILRGIEEVFDDLVAHSTDEALVEAWLAGSSPGLTKMQRLTFLSVLLSELGPTKRVEDVVGELRRLVSGTVHESLIEGRLARAGVVVR